LRGQNLTMIVKIQGLSYSFIIHDIDSDIPVIQSIVLNSAVWI